MVTQEANIFDVKVNFKFKFQENYIYFVENSTIVLRRIFDLIVEKYCTIILVIVRSIHNSVYFSNKICFQKKTFVLWQKL